MNSTPSRVLRQKWLAEMLPEVAFDGWTEAAASRAAETAGLTPGEKALAAPAGLTDLIDEFFEQAAETARSTLEAQDLTGLRVPDRVKAGLLAWLDALEPDQEAVRRAASRGFLPWQAGSALARSWKTADFIWLAAGDTSEDYNHYTKRGLLAAVVPSIVLYWLDNPPRAELQVRIERRLAQVSGLGRNLGRFAKPLLDLLPSSRPNRGDA